MQNKGNRTSRKMVAWSLEEFVTDNATVFLTKLDYGNSEWDLGDRSLQGSCIHLCVKSIMLTVDLLFETINLLSLHLITKL